MSPFDRGEWVYKSRMQNFYENPCVKTARSVFLTCRKYVMIIPEPVLEIIGTYLKEEDDRWMVEQLKLKEAHDKKLWPKEYILSCALRTDSLEAAYDLYREKTGETKKNRSNWSLRKHLDRFLAIELTSIIGKYFSSAKTPSHLMPSIPKKVLPKLALYKELISIICAKDGEDCDSEARDA